MKEDAIENVEAGGRPIQILSWNEKEANGKAWYKKNADYYISMSAFSLDGNNNPKRGQDLKVLYDVYNSKFPLDWFKHVTDPLSAKEPAHKAFPAKIRPVTILRTNIDLLLGEYPRRPFIYQVNNLGDDGYSTYMEELNEKVNEGVKSYFKLALQKSFMEQGILTPDGQPVSEEAAQQVQEAMNNMQYPEDIEKEFKTSYRDKQAIKGQKWLKRALVEHKIREKQLKMFKDWLIVGQAYSYKGVEFDNLVYERISPMMIDFDKSPENEYVEDGEWVCVLRYMTASDITDRFYEVLKKEDHIKLRSSTIYNSANAFNSFLSSTYTTDSGKIPVYHVQWEGSKALGFLTRINPESGQPETIEVDEDYIAAEGESIEWVRVDEGYETWRIGKDMYIYMRPMPMQRNAMNNFSTLKLSYNGRKYSDTHSDNISAMEIGLPIQIMYIIVTRTLELTIAKSKGKILLIDQNAIPNKPGWTEEKFFYYSEALGYALLDRNQIGVDKSWNQYTTVDMSLFDNISQLIELQGYFKQQWDDVLGINRQRKGQTYASDLVGVNERAAFQSTVITDMIFNGFEEFVETELQGILDMSKFINASGVRKLWYDTEFGNQTLEIDPYDYCNAELGIFVESSAEAMQTKNKMEAQATAMLQNTVKPSTILEVFRTQSVADLKEKLLQIEEIQAKIEQQNATSEEEAAKQMDERKMKFMEYEKTLDTIFMNAEYDRKEDLEDIKGTYNTFTFQDGDSNDNGIPDAMEVKKMNLEIEKLNQKREQHMIDRADRLRKEQTDVNLKRKQLSLNEKALEDKASIERSKIRLNRKQ